MSTMSQEKQYEIVGAVILAISLAACIFCAFLSLNSDVYFLLNNGEHILSEGTLFPTELFDTLHEDFDTVIQQPLFCLILLSFYRLFGFIGIPVLSCLCLFACTTLLFLYFKGIRSSLVRYVIVSSYILMYCVIFCGRPSEITLLVLTLEVMILYDGGSRLGFGKMVVLYVLSIFSLLSHAAFYPFFLFILAFFCVRDSIAQKHLCVGHVIVFCFSFFSSFLTPYGYKLPLYLLISYPTASKGGYIQELKTPTLLSVYTVFLAAVLIVVIKTIRREYIIDALLVVVGMILLVLHVRNFWILGIFSLPYLRDVTADEGFRATVPKVLHYSVPAVTLAVFVVILCSKVYSDKGFEPRDSAYSPVLACGYLSRKDARLFTEFNNGAFFEFNGMRAFIDARPELYSKVINGKADLYDEYLSLCTDSDFDYSAFINKYDFDYLLASKTSRLYLFLRVSDGYNEVVKGEGYSLFEVTE